MFWLLKWSIITGVIATAIFLYFKYHQKTETVYIAPKATETSVGCAGNKELQEICNDPKFKKGEELKARKILANNKKTKLEADYNSQKSAIEAELEQIRKEELAIGITGSF